MTEYSGGAMLQNKTNKPITIKWGCTQRTIFPGCTCDVDKEFDCVIEQRFADKYAGKLVKYTIEPTVIFSEEVKTLSSNVAPTIKTEKVITKKPKPKKR